MYSAAPTSLTSRTGTKPPINLQPLISEPNTRLENLHITDEILIGSRDGEGQEEEYDRNAHDIHEPFGAGVEHACR